MRRLVVSAITLLALASPAVACAEDWSLRASPQELKAAQKKLQNLGAHVEQRHRSLVAYDVSRSEINKLQVDSARTSIPVHIAHDPLVKDAQWSAWDGFLGIDEAWQVGQGQGAVVAVVDTGVDLSHPDLINNLWTNPGEIPDNGIDDDKNGYVDDLHGASVRNGGPPQDGNGHGTHVSGIVASSLNGFGVNGIAPQARIMAVQSLDSEGEGMSSDVAAGIRYAVANGADIINLSIVADAVTPEDQQVVDSAEKAGILIVGAAGNEGKNISNRPNSPASLDNANLINVASVNDQGARSSFSNYGSNVEIAAFGEDIPSTYFGNRYALFSGTSMAAPMVSGVAAVIAGLYKDRGGEEWRESITSTATKLPGLKNSVSSGGIANLAGALAWEAERAGGNAPKKSVRFRSVSLKSKKSGSRYRLKITWSLSGGGTGDITRVKAAIKNNTSSSTKDSTTLSRLTKGRKKLKLTAYDSTGSARASRTVSFKLG